MSMASLKDILLRRAFHRPSVDLVAPHSHSLEAKHASLRKADVIRNFTPSSQCRPSASVSLFPIECQLSSRHLAAKKRPLSDPIRAVSPSGVGATEVPPGRAEPLHSAEVHSVSRFLSKIVFIMRVELCKLVHGAIQ